MNVALGSKLLGCESKDAVHVAIVPVLVQEDLAPGTHVVLRLELL